jgi:hypothetical protein
MTMRTLFLALLLTLTFAGSARAQERVRTGPLPAATAAAPRAGRPVPARIVRQPRATVRAVMLAAKARLQTAAGARTAPPRPAKRPAPRS